MKYTYAYKTSDGQRHEASLEADSREAVFTALRAQGIKAIKVVAADGSKDNGEVVVRGVRKRVVTILAITVSLFAGAVAFWLGRGGSMSRPHGHESGGLIEAALPSRIAHPLPRQMIPGDRERIDQSVASLTNAAERALAAFAEPGRPLARMDGARPTDAEFAATLRLPLRIAADEFTESIDLKRIVTGIKVEMRNYLAGGGTVSGYLAECVKRQKQEIAYRTRAEEHLKKMLNRDVGPATDSSPCGQELARKVRPAAPDFDSASADVKQSAVQLHPSPSPDLPRTYAYWLKANAQLQSMGIYPLPLPSQLREYQLSIDIEE